MIDPVPLMDLLLCILSTRMDIAMSTLSPSNIMESQIRRTSWNGSWGGEKSGGDRYLLFLIQTDRYTHRLTDTRTCTRALPPKCLSPRQTDRQTYIQTGRQTDRQTDRYTHRQTDRQTHTQTDRLTDRQTDTYTQAVL